LHLFDFDQIFDIGKLLAQAIRPLAILAGSEVAFGRCDALRHQQPRNCAVVCFTSVLLSLIAISLSPFLLYLNPRRAALPVLMVFFDSRLRIGTT
jgi:hypothetical protein